VKTNPTSEVAPNLPPELAPVRPGDELDWPSLTTYLRTNFPGLDGEFRVRQFPRGWANLTYLVEFGDRRLVVRRPPFGDLAPGAHDMGREYRILSRLWQTYDKAPRAFVHCDDHSIVGSDFLVMEYRDGVVIWGEIPPSMRSHLGVGRRIGFAVADALAELHRLDPATSGLGDLGRPDGFLERQIAGWNRRWRLVAPDRAEPLMEIIGERLARATPTKSRPAILHNDFKIDNCQFDPGDPDRVKSIFDWDMATLGDPLVDLGTLLNYWPDPDDTEDSRTIVNPGMETLGLPTRTEVVERYRAGTGFDIANVSWYEAFACWKRAVIMQQIYVRYLRGETTDTRMAAQVDWISHLARRAETILDASERLG
jgi:aminoglycoside phosphotransferase (APT) family kinase protein